MSSQKQLFYTGDRVIYRAKNATVRDVVVPEKDGEEFVYKIEIDLPNNNWTYEFVEQSKIKFYGQYKERCPTCGCPWVVTQFNVKTWKDCLKCFKTEEEIEKQRKNKSPLSYMETQLDFGLYHSD